MTIEEILFVAAAGVCLVIGYIFGARTREPRRPPIIVPGGEHAVLWVSKGCCVADDVAHVFDDGRFKIVVDDDECEEEEALQ